MQAQGFLDLIADSENRIKGCAGLLKNITYHAAANGLQLRRLHFQDVAALEEDFAAGIKGGRARQQPRDGKCGDAFARSTFANETERFAGVQRKGKAVHRPQRVGAAAKVHLQISNFQQRHITQLAGFMRGSIQPYIRSTTQLASTTNVALNKTVPMIIGGSRLKTLCTARVPMPGKAKTFSVNKTPPSSPATSMPRIVTTGIKALRSACAKSTRVSDAPLARAARTYGLSSASTMLVWIKRA